MEQIGRYRILSELGRGAMGIVYKAQDPSIGRLVAIKTIRLNEMIHPEEREQLRNRLFREAQSAGILNHPGIVTIYDIAEERDLAYISMEYVEGQTLEKIMETGHTGDAKFVIDVAAQTALALDYAHSRGIVHRDIKPGNIMVNVEGQVKITDFGIARIASSKFTHTGTVMGTPAYMSPEQVRGAVVDGRSDMFSLAVVLYEMLTGIKPFSGESITTIIFKIVSENPIPPKEVNPSVGSKLNAVIMRALAKEPSERYQSCREFADAVQAAAAQTANLTPVIRRTAATHPSTTARLAMITQPGSGAPTPAAPSPAAASSVAETVVEKKLPPLERGAPPTVRAPAFESAAPSRRWPWLAVAALAAAGGWWWRSMQIRRPEARNAGPPAVASAPEQGRSAPPPDSPAPQAGRAEPAPAPPKSGGAAPPAARTAPPSAGSLIHASTAEPGATVVVDGNQDLKCTTPCTLEVAAGRHSLLFTQVGRYPERREVQAGSDPVVISVSLRPILGTVMVNTSPPGAAVAVDGRAATGETPLTLKLPFGKHVITASKSGYAPAERTIEVADDNILSVTIALGNQQ